jgi:hypothetical protein
MGLLESVIKIVFKADATDVPRKASEVKRSLNEVERGASKLQKQTEGLRGTFERLRAAWAILIGAFAVKKFVGYVEGWSNLAAQAERANIAFTYMAKKAGVDAAKTLESMSKAARGLIEDSDLMIIAFKAWASGIPVERMGEFIALAEKMAPLMRTDTAGAIDILTNSIGRMSARLLTQYGITVSVKDITEESGEEYVTTAEKTEYWNTVLDELIDKFGAMKTPMAEAADSTKRLGVAWAELQEEMGRGFGPGWTDFKNWLADKLDDIRELRQRIEAEQANMAKRRMLERQFLMGGMAVPKGPLPYGPIAPLGPEQPAGGGTGGGGTGGGRALRWWEMEAQLEDWYKKNVGRPMPLHGGRTRTGLVPMAEPELPQTADLGGMTPRLPIDEAFDRAGLHSQAYYDQLEQGAFRFEGTMLQIIHNIDEGFSHLFKSIAAQWATGILSRLLGFGMSWLLTSMFPGGGLAMKFLLGGALPFGKAQHGAIINNPSLVLAGEKGREAIVPLEGPEARKFGTTVNINLPHGVLSNEIEAGRRLGEWIERTTQDGSLSTRY